MGAMDALGPILGSQLAAPVMALDFPSLHKLKVTGTKRFDRGVTGDYYGWGVLQEAEELPDRLIINGVFEGGGRWSLGIDLEEEVIASFHGNVHGDTHYGSAAIGIALFGSPALLLTSPILLLAYGIYGLGRLATGMDRHSYVLFQKVGPQLMTEDADVLWRALQNQHNGKSEAYTQRRQDDYDAKRRAEKLAERFESWKDDYTDGPFMDRYDHGCADESEVMKDYEDWQRRQSADQNVKAHEWLGMSENEFKAWYSQEKTVLQLLEERHAQVPANPTHQG